MDGMYEMCHIISTWEVLVSNDTKNHSGHLSMLLPCHMQKSQNPSCENLDMVIGYEPLVARINLGTTICLDQPCNNMFQDPLKQLM